METVINVRAAKAALRVWEVPSYECRRIHGQSNLNAVRDGFRVVRKIWSECPAICARYTGAMAAPEEAVAGLLPLPHREEPVSIPQLVTGTDGGSRSGAAVAPRTATFATNGNGATNGATGS